MALFMVLAAIATLAILVTQLTYTAQVNQKMAFDGLDLVKAHYLAKTGLKLSLLRLKAYQNLKSASSALGGGTPGGGGAVPKGLLEKVWSFPFFYPIPTNVPGLGPSEKDMIEKFQKASGLDGRMTAVIESESARQNLNSIVPKFAALAVPSPSPAPSGSPSPSPSPSLDPEVARKSLGDYLFQLVSKKVESDPDFADDYRDFKPEELIDTIAGWADITYERKFGSNRDPVPMKRAPFYNLSELHMLRGIDDRLYDLFAPNLTVSATTGVNVNTIQSQALHALVPQMNDDELKEFFKYRDDENEDHLFNNADDFFKYLQGAVNGFHNNPSEIQAFRDSLTQRGIQILTEETNFKITVQATVNQSTQTLEAWVTLEPKQSSPSATSPTSTPGPGQPQTSPTPGATGTGTRPSPGLRITYMRIL